MTAQRPHLDEGLQPERTSLAWSRTSWSLAVTSAIFIHWSPRLGPSLLVMVAVALLAASVLYLIRAETRTRESAATAARSGGVTAVAMTIGAVAIVGALVAGPVLPTPVAGAGTGVAASIDPTLNLGADLRRRSDVPVLTMHGDATTLPYLRVATLSQFDGQVWMPDRTRSVALPDGLEPLVVAPDVAVTERRTSISVSALSSSALPVPYAAVEITGIDDTWRTSPYSRTVLSGRSSAQGQNYEVLSQQATPTLEQIQSTRAATAESSIDVTSLPEDTPAVIGELAAQVTAGAGSDYDKLLALQSWFRGPEFRYSLDTPVEEGFDGSGAEAVAEFLTDALGPVLEWDAARGTSLVDTLDAWYAAFGVSPDQKEYIAPDARARIW
mgnify:CR=1 FL=1